MSFISFSLRYYKEKLELWESSLLSHDDIYLVKQHLKMLDDLVDEGYTYLYNRMEDEYNGISRLKVLLNKYNATPFENYKFNEDLFNSNLVKMELNECISELIIKSNNYNRLSSNPLLNDIINFSKWIGNDDNTAYVFLLRDTLLPYIYFDKNYKCEAYPWLIGRSFMEYITKEKNIDDIIRSSIFDALECCSDFNSFKDFCKNKILNDLKKYPIVIDQITSMLKSINKDKIIVVESGCYGTFPLLLCILDDRVDFKMFTTVPYLFDIYKDRIYTNEYEKNRLFETLYSQDKLFKFDSYVDNKYYVLINESDELNNKAMAEIKKILDYKGFL